MDGINIKSNQESTKYQSLMKSEGENQLVKLLVPPNDIIEDLIVDIQGVEFLRGE